MRKKYGILIIILSILLSPLIIDYIFHTIWSLASLFFGGILIYLWVCRYDKKSREYWKNWPYTSTEDRVKASIRVGEIYQRIKKK